jgi:thermostable 8-oxoguanine DNA glycosylase
MANPQELKINWVEFIDLVKQMRHNQRRFENLRREEINETRKKLELEVDTVIAKLTDTQLELWNTFTRGTD